MTHAALQDTIRPIWRVRHAGAPPRRCGDPEPKASRYIVMGHGQLVPVFEAALAHEGFHGLMKKLARILSLRPALQLAQVDNGFQLQTVEGANLRRRVWALAELNFILEQLVRRSDADVQADLLATSYVIHDLRHHRPIAFLGLYGQSQVIRRFCN